MLLSAVGWTICAFLQFLALVEKPEFRASNLGKVDYAHTSGVAQTPYTSLVGSGALSKLRLWRHFAGQMVSRSLLHLFEGPLTKLAHALGRNVELFSQFLE